MPTTGRARRRGRELITILVITIVVAATVAFGGPLTSGALLLLLPAPARPRPHDLPPSYEPRHKGFVSVSDGLYVRKNEDLVVRGTPPLFLRRTYLSRYHVQREFGVGATHDGERYLHGDPNNLEWASLINADGSRIDFGRVSFGRFLSNAMFAHHGTPSEYFGARLGWIGFAWALRRVDGTLSIFQQCGPNIAPSCSIVRDRDPDGHIIEYRRDAASRLIQMESGPDRWIRFAYDANRRIVRAADSNGRSVRYGYDARGRLMLAQASDGGERRYTYTDRDELATIEEPGTRITNVYEDGRVVRQLNWFPDRGVPYVFEFTYRTEGRKVLETQTRESSGAWVRRTFNQKGYVTAEQWGNETRQYGKFVYELDVITNVITAITLECLDRRGHLLPHSLAVNGRDPDWARDDLLRTHCTGVPLDERVAP